MDVIYVAMQEANRPQHEGAGYWLIVTMSDGTTYRGAISVTPFEGFYNITLADSEAPRDVFLNGQHAATAEIDW